MKSNKGEKNISIIFLRLSSVEGGAMLKLGLGAIGGGGPELPILPVNAKLDSWKIK